MFEDIRPRKNVAPATPAPNPQLNTVDPQEPMSSMIPMDHDDSDDGLTAPVVLNGTAASAKSKENVFKRIKSHIHKPHSKKGWAMLIASILVLVGGIGAGGYALMQSRQPEPIQAAVVPPPEPPSPPPAPTTAASKLTGVQIAIPLSERPITGVMIENSPSARPQAGFKDAGVVFEAVAEGGITRFLALFQDGQPEKIGPVRSARPYYIDWALGFDASYAHVGGSPEGLAHIRATGTKDLDQFGNPGAYYRSSDRVAPHNMYTSMAKLDELNASKGYTASTFTGFARHDAEAPAVTPTAKTVNLSPSSASYNVRYDYEAASNSYKRFMAGVPHVDQNGGVHLAPKVVIAMVMSRSQNGIYSVYNQIGNGQAIVFQNGEIITGTWEKAASKSPIAFKDAAGQLLKLAPGQTWITAVTPAQVTHTP